MIKKISNYSKYIFQEIIFLFNLIWYIAIHPTHLSYIKKYIKQKPGITMEKKIPWLNFRAIIWLENNLNKNMTVFEWGSGGSTLFFASKVKKIISVEHDKEWYNKVCEEIKKENVLNCEYLLLPASTTKDGNVDEGIIYKEYYEYIKKYGHESFDLILVDGWARNECVLEAKSKIKSGGVIILDNSERKIYKPGIEALKDFRRIDFYGPGPYNHYFWRTSLFIKP